MRGDYVVAAVRTGGPGAAGISMLVIEKGTPGFEVSRKLAKMGWRSSDTAELSFTDARVPVENLVGAENTGFLQIAQAFVSERVGLAVQAYSSAQRCLDITVAWCRDRETFGKPLISRQSVQNTLADMARRIDVARVYSRNVIERQLAGETNLIAEVCFARTPPSRPANGWPIRPCNSSAAWDTWPSARSNASTATCGSSASAAAPPRS